MLKRSKFSVAPLFCLIIFSVCAVSSQAQMQTEIEKWTNDTCVDTQKGAIFDYTYLLKVSFEKPQKLGLGRKFTRLYEAILPSRFTSAETYSHPLVLIEDSEKIITRSFIENARRNLVRKMEKAESIVDKPGEGQRNLDGGYWTMQLTSSEQLAKVDILKMVKISHFTNLQHKIINGRSIVSMDFTPQTASIFDPAMMYVSKIEGQIWIDEVSKRIIRVEGFPVGMFNKIKSKPDAERENEAVLFFLQTKVAEGFWFPQIVRLDFTKHREIFDAIKLEFNFSGYKKAKVEIRDLQIENSEEMKMPTPE